MLVVQDFAAAEGIFCASGSSSSGSSSSSAGSGCGFPLLEELGVMLRGAAGAAAMRQLRDSCRDLRKLSIYQHLTPAVKPSSSCCASTATNYAELLGLSVMTKLTHLELKQVVFNDSAADELQRLLPCTRISV
ncbi:hypothetical protein OEZ86_004659 [Tetradesmus obliquus]|nr:hypothetical protein OEZ86_004659 [Tetradesmus obliquus]